MLEALPELCYLILVEIEAVRLRVFGFFLTLMKLVCSSEHFCV